MKEEIAQLINTEQHTQLSAVREIYNCMCI